MGDGQCNENEEDHANHKQVGQNAPMFHQLLYVT